MALTAWETYVEDRVREEFKIRIRVVEGSYVGKFVASRLEDELKRFHNPTAAKTRKLFLDYLEVDVTDGWNWEHFDSARAQKTLDELIAKRGDAVHRSSVSVITPKQVPNLIKRDELEKAIRFLKCLVRATDAQLSHEKLLDIAAEPCMSASPNIHSRAAGAYNFQCSSRTCESFSPFMQTQFTAQRHLD